MIWIKVCGTTNLEDAQAAIKAGADALGFVFAESPRKIERSKARDIISQLPQGAEKIGVFVDEPCDRILEIAKETGLTGVQLHGDESPMDVGTLRKGGGQQMRIIKAIRLNDPAAGSQLAIYGANRRLWPDAILLDSGTGKRGGTGEKFKWEQWAGVAQQLSDRLSVIAAGGLTAENIGEALKALSPWGVDVVTGLEESPGKKNHDKVRAFIAASRAADNK